MRLRKILLLIIPILILITLIPQNVLATTSVDKPARVNETYEWGSGFYSMEAEKNTWVTIKGVKNTIDTYNEDTYDNVAIEPSVGYAYYAAKTLGLDDSDIQSVISTSDSWNNTTNVKVRGSSQEIDGTGTLYKRAKQYGTVYYGILEDSIRNNKRVFRIKNEDDVKSNIKVLTDQDTGTYTVGPYKLELNIDSNEYTNEGAKILYNELNRNGNEGYSLQNAFAKTNNIGGMNTKEGTNPIFVDEKGKQIVFPDFIPGQEKNFYIRFVPANEGAIVETGNPIINTSYLTKFTAEKFVKGTPTTVKFGATNISKTNKLASTNFEDSNTISGDKTEVIEQKESTLKKREYGEPAVVQLDDESKQAMQKQLGLISNIETGVMRKVGAMTPEEIKQFYREIHGSPEGIEGRAFKFSHWKDVITIDKNGNIVYYYKNQGEYGFKIYENGTETEVFTYLEDGILANAHHYDMLAHAYIGKINPTDSRVKVAMDKAANGIGIRDGTFQPMWILQEAAEQVGSVNIITEKGAAQIFYPESITLRQKEALDFVFSYATPQETIAKLNPGLKDTTNFEVGTFNSSTRRFGNWLVSATPDDAKSDIETHLPQTSTTTNSSNGNSNNSSSNNITALFVPDNYTYSADVGYTQKYIPISSEKRISGAMTLEEVARNPGGDFLQIEDNVFNSNDIQSFGTRGQQIVDNGQDYEVVKSGRHHTLGGDGDAETVKLSDSSTSSTKTDTPNSEEFKIDREKVYSLIEEYQKKSSRFLYKNNLFGSKDRLEDEYIGKVRECLRN